MILFSAIDYEECSDAYNWHRGFSGANDALFPRQHDDFQTMVYDGRVWAARDAGGDYLALAYSSYDEAKLECEIGGLMVAAQARKKGLGLMMMRLALTHALLEEDLLSQGEVRIVAHVLASNEAPRGIIQDGLRFKHASVVEIDGAQLPGLRADPDGKIRGDEYELAKPDSLIALAEWAHGWTGFLPNAETADIDFRSGVDIAVWRKALDDLVTRHSPVAQPQGARSK